MTLPLDDPPRVLGLDLSLTATGICRPDGSTVTVKTRLEDGDKRLALIVDAVELVITQHDVDLAIIEDLPKNAMGGGITGMVHGAVRHTLIRHGVPYALVIASSLKAFATGKGGASKSDMAVAAFQRAGAVFGDDNQCDAWWCRVVGLVRLGMAPFKLPAAQTARLGKVRWPEELVIGEEPMRA
jgi:Holliday junction resolvasome RuvABC endonuclease subunit